MLRLSPPPTQKEPVTPRILRQLRQDRNFNNARECVLWGAALMDYFFMLRRSEYLADRGQVKPYILRYAGVTCITQDGKQAQHEAEATSIRVFSVAAKRTSAGGAKPESSSALDSGGHVPFAPRGS
ncbi:hypothetical protein PHYSODRAFT_321409 [Phytophthora sojae]|uniref:Uncharacterized protein n=1 Tax=Phytophthora sojae (strain P6497) TaxID=1094619 RepID=G4YFR0_PHYSP|nr:hypothetical protein PHYSODRAFT_321409 [Phytophthora sojae]EGZ27637.1 hypothetical protein PHYSODRAFT_321409 [Phytophthora sojae]|eukprot:XP_009514912.1 hypothetical protein PHYSODRAFT_321409 [Phytophthora sojae]